MYAEIVAVLEGGYDLGKERNLGGSFDLIRDVGGVSTVFTMSMASPE